MFAALTWSCLAFSAPPRVCRHAFVHTDTRRAVVVADGEFWGADGRDSELLHKLRLEVGQLTADADAKEASEQQTCPAAASGVTPASHTPSTVDAAFAAYADEEAKHTVLEVELIHQGERRALATVAASSTTEALTLEAARLLELDGDEVTLISKGMRLRPGVPLSKSVLAYNCNQVFTESVLVMAKPKAPGLVGTRLIVPAQPKPNSIEELMAEGTEEAAAEQGEVERLMADGAGEEAMPSRAEEIAMVYGAAEPAAPAESNAASALDVEMRCAGQTARVTVPAGVSKDASTVIATKQALTISIPVPPGTKSATYVIKASFE